RLLPDACVGADLAPQRFLPRLYRREQLDVADRLSGVLIGPEDERAASVPPDDGRGGVNAGRQSLCRESYRCRASGVVENDVESSGAAATQVEARRTGVLSMD